jgi:hypothetical protein
MSDELDNFEKIKARLGDEEFKEFTLFPEQLREVEKALGIRLTPDADGYLIIRGLRCRVVPLEEIIKEAEESGVVMCSPKAHSQFKDDVHTTCEMCQRAIVHRPYLPPSLIHVCPWCAVKVGVPVPDELLATYGDTAASLRLVNKRIYRN